MKNTQKAFTLVELLVVVAIIGLLATMLTPVVMDAMFAAKKTAEVARLQQMVQAIRAFKSQYGYYPTFFKDNNAIELDDATGNAKKFYNCLSGAKEGENGGNRKRIQFITFNSDEYQYLMEGFSRSSGGTNSAGSQPKTPMGGDNGNIFVAVDFDGDGKIELPGNPGPGPSSTSKGPLRADILIYSKGGNDIGKDTYTDKMTLMTWIDNYETQ